MRWSAGLPRPGRPPARDAGAALAALAAAVALQALTAAPAGTPAWFTGPGPVALLALAAMTLPLAYRRAAPVAGLLVHTAAAVPVGAGTGVEPPWSLVPAVTVGIVLLYGVAAGRSPAVAVPVLAGAALLDAAAAGRPRPADAVLSVVGTAAVGTAGWAARRRRLAREGRLRAALAAERARIVRELNDLVAHQVLGIVLRAAAARDRAGTGAAGAALVDIEAAAREALAAMRRMLRVLRRGAPLPAPVPIRWRPGPADAAVALSPLPLLALSAPETAGPPEWVDLLVAGRPAVTLPLLAAALAALLVRRRAPVRGLLVVVLAQLGYEAAGGVSTPTNLAVLIATYSVGAWPSRPAPRAWTRTVPATLAAMLALGVTSAHGLPPDTDRGPVVALLPCALGLGLVARRWRRRLDDRRRDGERAAAGVGRTLLARELHDVVAHHVSGIVVRATAAGAEPGPALADIETSARAALAGLRQLPGVLDVAPATAPQPGLAEIGRLVEATRAAGLRVHADVMATGHAPVGAEIELLAHRVVQEALTNCVKHAAGSSVRVTVGRRADTLVLQVRDDGGRGQSPVPRTDPGGYGLLGMRERVELLGGTLTAGPTVGGGWLVHARVPLRGGEEKRWASGS